MESWNVQDVENAMNERAGKNGRPGYVCFAAERGKNCCKTCQENHGRIFRADDPERPEIPVHPNCKCKYIPLG